MADEVEDLTNYLVSGQVDVTSSLSQIGEVEVEELEAAALELLVSEPLVSAASW